MNIELDDEQAAALIKELHDIVENDPYPFSPRIRTLRATREASARTSAGAFVAAKSVCAAASHTSQKAVAVR
jgi:hypothetical protein